MNPLKEMYSDFMTDPALSMPVDEISGFPGNWEDARITVLKHEMLFSREDVPDNAWGVDIPDYEGRPAFMLMTYFFIFSPDTGLTLEYEWHPSGPEISFHGLEATTARQRRQLDPLITTLSGLNRRGNPALIFLSKDYDDAAFLIENGQDYELIAGRFENRAAFDKAMKARKIG